MTVQQKMISSRIHWFVLGPRFCYRGSAISYSGEASVYLDWPLIYLHIYWATEPPLSNVRCNRFDIEKIRKSHIVLGEYSGDTMRVEGMADD